MLNKKVLILGVVLLLCSILAIGCGGTSTTGPAAPTPVPNIEDEFDMANAYVVGDVFDKQYLWDDTKPNNNAPANGDGYYGPWGPGVSYPNDGTLVFDCSTTDTYFTMDLVTVPAAADTYQYALIRLKVDDAATATDVTDTLGITSLTIGNATHVFLKDWGITSLSTTYQTYALKLADHGFTAWPVPGTGVAFIAMNQDGDGKAVKIIIDKIVLANRK